MTCWLLCITQMQCKAKGAQENEPLLWSTQALQSQEKNEITNKNDKALRLEQKYNYNI